MSNLAIVQTPDGPRCIAPGVCAVCGWRGWDKWDVGLKPIPTEPNSWIVDADPVCRCPNCTLTEVDVYPSAKHDSLASLPAKRERTNDDEDDDALFA